ncbi:hypothetical protein [Demequina capsici]|uniref:Uncharacterized protein n=1 Tax=Demequina capsici TaxID=3075620 RepID=A0AA96F7Z7_9MICO|nr:hypothetical protein [Demequina sp. OYTSA14]WNM25284.1 hypothetical protein RN606_03815 [Demequina sp. OYTSA14]
MHGSDWFDFGGELSRRLLGPTARKFLALALVAFLAYTAWGHAVAKWYVDDKAAALTETMQSVIDHYVSATQEP